ncbi:MAG: hypothetical protein ABGZ53_35635 [Fuerstiella sp.]
MKTRIEHQVVATGIAWLCCAVAAIAHPMSHTDAWVRVSDVVDVRLNIFLDDVLRHQEDLSSGRTTVPGSVGVAAIARHAETLLRQLQIFDAEGRPLIGKIVSVPEWQPASEVIDLTQDASLKLSWTLQFEAAESRDGGFRRLCFLHTFSHPDLLQPGELRLHLQHKPSGRRIDAVVAPETPHTIVLPAGDSSAAPSDSTDINTAVSRIVVAPNEVIHEFTAPLLLLDVAWPRAAEIREKLVVGHPGGSTLDPAASQEAKHRIATWLQSNCKLRVNSSVVSAGDVSIEYFDGAADSSFASGPTADFALSPDEPAPVVGTRIGARMRFPYGRSVQSVELLFGESPGKFSQLTVDIITATEHQTQILKFNDETADHPSGLLFKWNRSPGSLIPPIGKTHRIPTVAMASPIHVEHQRPGRIGLQCFILCMALAFCTWRVRSAKASQPFLTRGSCAVLLFGLLLAFLVPDITHRVDNERAGRLVEQLLSDVYRAIADGGTDALAESLSATVGDDLTEQIYLSTIQCLQNDQSDGVLINFSKANVLNMDSDERLTTAGRMYGNCTWLVRGSVYHWGHIHERQMQFSGEIVLSRHDDNWKITSLSPTEFSTIRPEIEPKDDS